MKTKTKIAFIIQKKLYIKFLGPVIEHLSKKNFEIHILYDYSQSRYSLKWRDFPSIDLFHSNSLNKIKKKIFFNTEDLLKIINNGNIKIIASLLPYNYFNLSKKKLRNVNWILFQHGMDLFWKINDNINSDYIFLYSDYWKKLLIKFFKNKNLKYNSSKLIVTGNPQFEYTKFSTNIEIREKYNIPLKKKVFLFLCLGQPNDYSYLEKNIIKSLYLKLFFISPNIESKFYWIRKIIYKLSSYILTNELTILRNFSNLCKKKGYFLIFKSRSKRILDDYIKSLSNLILYDDQLVPSTTLELMKISDNTASFISTSPGESAFSESYHFTISHKLFSSFENIYTRSFDKDYFDYNQVNQMVTISELENYIEKKKLKKINLTSRMNYLNKYYDLYSKNKSKIEIFLSKLR